jgi:hypothetical protein
MSDSRDSLPWLHIYPQHGPHDCIEIHGTLLALRGLRDAIDRLLQSGMDAQASAYTTDGEGYEVIFRNRSCAALSMGSLPYVDDE